MKRRIRDPVHGLIVFGDGGNEHRNETDRIAWKLVKTHEDLSEPVDIHSVSEIVMTLRKRKHIQRAYVPSSEQADALEKLLGDLIQ